MITEYNFYWQIIDSFTQWEEGVELARNFHWTIYFTIGSPKVWPVLIHIFSCLQTVHSEAEDVLASDCIVCKHKECDVGTCQKLAVGVENGGGW